MLRGLAGVLLAGLSQYGEHGRRFLSRIEPHQAPGPNRAGILSPGFSEMPF